MQEKQKPIRMKLPFELVYREAFDSLILAGKREQFLKSGKGRAILAKIVDPLR